MLILNWIEVTMAQNPKNYGWILPQVVSRCQGKQKTADGWRSIRRFLRRYE